jgi:hypothetical protein
MILALHKGLHGIADFHVVQVGNTQPGPHFWLVNFLSVVLSPMQIADVHDQHIQSLRMHVLFLVNGEGFFKQVVSGIHRDAGDFYCIVIVQTVNVVHDSGLVRFYRCDDQQVLQFLVLREV